jgi:hypothetical protein
MPGENGSKKDKAQKAPRYWDKFSLIPLNTIIHKNFGHAFLRIFSGELKTHLRAP